MDFKHFEMIDKSDIVVLREYYHSLRIIKDSVEKIIEGKYYHVTVLYSQLRALLTDRSTSPLLLKVAEMLNEEITLYFMPNSIKQGDRLSSHLTLQISSAPLTLKRVSNNQKKISVKDYLEETIVTLHGRSFTARTIINEMANKYGAHYSKSTPQYLSSLLCFGLNQMANIDNLIMQIANVIIDIGIMLLKKITDFEFSIYLNLPTVKIPIETFIFDFKLPENHNRIFLVEIQNNLRLGIVDNIGRFEVLDIHKGLFDDQVGLLNVTVRTTAQFSTEIRIYSNNNLVNELELVDPLFMINSFNQFDQYYNKSFEGKPQKYSFKMGESIAYGKVLNQIDKAQLINYLHSKKDITMVKLSENSYAHIKPNGEKMVFIGDVVLEKVHI